MKFCTKCALEKDLEDFVKDRSRPSGRGSWCKPCHREVAKIAIAKWRDRNLSTYLSAFFVERYAKLQQIKEVPCADCSQQYPWYVMDFDHLDPSTKAGHIALMVGQTIAWDRVLAEIAKCEIVCVCCHRLRTWTAPKTASKCRALISSLKARPCLDCRSSLHYCQMDFDHVRGLKLGEVSQMKTEAKILAEAEKCEVICANCHRARTYARKQGNLPWPLQL